MAEQGQEKRIRYAKPEAVDIGGVASITGASCRTGGQFDNPGNPRCQGTGNGDTHYCSTGNSARGTSCVVGNSYTP
jgi:hypothetical protein